MRAAGHYHFLLNTTSGAPSTYLLRSPLLLARPTDQLATTLAHDKMGFVASGELTPGKARVLLQLSLTTTHDPIAIQKMFYAN